MSRTTELFATTAAAGVGAAIAVLAVGGSLLVALPTVVTVVLVLHAGRRPST